MYCPNNQLSTLPQGQDELYTKLYYTFIKRAFNLFYAQENLNIKIFFDELPESLKISNKFKRLLISGIVQESKNYNTKVSIYKNNIFEVDSKKHPILQCVDVILGVIEFYLNSTKEDQQTNRGKAKLQLFNHIYDNYIMKMCENFDFDISTGYFNTYRAWQSSYKHLVYKRKKSPN